MDLSKQKLEEKRSELGLIGKIWDRNDVYQDERAQVEEDEAVLAHLIEKRSVLEDKQSELLENIQEDQNILDGKVTGIWASIKAKASSFTGSIANFRNKLDHVLNRFDEIGSDMIYVMSAFIFRTLIMPLVFLYALTRVFRLTWGVDIHTVIQQGKEEFKREFRIGKNKSKALSNKDA